MLCFLRDSLGKFQKFQQKLKIFLTSSLTLNELNELELDFFDKSKIIFSCESTSTSICTLVSLSIMNLCSHNLTTIMEKRIEGFLLVPYWTGASFVIEMKLGFYYLICVGWMPEKLVKPIIKNIFILYFANSKILSWLVSMVG